MRYRYNNIYDIVKDDSSNISMQDIEKVIKDLIPSQDSGANDFDSKFKELEKLIDENTNQLESLNKEKDELLKLVDERLNIVEDKLDRLSGKANEKNDLEIVMDELEKQKQFNEFICDKVDDRIDRINELIDFINDMKAQLDDLDPNNNISKDAEELQEQLEHINERLTRLESGETKTALQTDEQEKVEEIVDKNNDDEDAEFESKINELLALLEEQKEENAKLTEELSKRNLEDEDSFNENWLKEFEEMQLSLEDDGIYEYDVEDLGEDMKYEYYNGDLPKTKVVKVKANDSVRNYSHDEINSFIGEEARKLASKEIDKLQSDSEMTQKAWLANNQRLNEMASIIEKQEEEIRRLNAYSKVQDPKYLGEGDPMSELEKRIARLENGSSDGRLSSLEEQLEAERKENARLRSMLENSEKKPEPVVVNVNNVPPVTPTPVEETKRESTIVGAQRRKRKQKFFFEIKEHNGPKITKADLDKDDTKKSK